MMRRMFAFVLALVLVFSLASAETVPESAGMMLPESAVLQSFQDAGMMRLYTFLIPETGEEVVLNCDVNDHLLYVQTQKPARIGDAAKEIDRTYAEELVLRTYPDSHILFAREDAAGKLLGVVGNHFCGSIVVADEYIYSRRLEACVPFRDGVLTLEGALKVLALHRPEAEFRALELEEDDGIWEYEGEALINGEKYEFELNARTGKLLEWERDS